MTDSCSTCFFFRTFNVIKRGSTTPVGVCARNAPDSGSSIEQATTLWPEIKDPANWWCGDFLTNYPAAPLWQDWAPVVTSNTGTITASTTPTKRYATFGKLTLIDLVIIVGTIGTGGGSLNFTLPSVAANSSSFFGRIEPFAGGSVSLQGYVLAGFNQALTVNYAGAYPIAANNDLVRVNGFYESQ